MILVAVSTLGIFFYIVAWATILKNAIYTKEKDTFTLKFWIFLHLALIVSSIIFWAITNR